MNNNLMDCEKSNNNMELNSQMLSMLATDMHDVLSKYILECLMWKVTSVPAVGQRVSENASVTNQPNMSLKQLAMSKRSHVIAPIPIYPTSETGSSKEDKRDRSESISTARDENTFPNTVKREFMSPQKLDEFDESPKRKSKAAKKSKDEIKKIKMELTFDNDTGELATRCDVVYKTILRDCRRFFLDSFKLHKQRRGHSTDMADSLFQFMVSLLPTNSVRTCKTLSIDLGCLLFPKEMTKDSKFLAEIESTQHFGDAQNSVEEIMRIHGFLYKFSIDKIQECFENLSLCKLFLYYVEATRDNRISENPTMNRNASIYKKARNILEEKALSSLSE